MGEFIDDKGDSIKWNYIKNLHELQETEGLNLANKLRKQHIQFDTQNMKVKLAVQAFSMSVADATELCRKEGLTTFNGSEATVKFIRIMNNLFDILNSRNKLQKNWKKTVFHGNFNKTVEFLNYAYDYIGRFKDKKGIRIILSKRKVGFSGFMVCIKSTLDLYERLVINPLRGGGI